jgi:hypothetical protein
VAYPGIPDTRKTALLSEKKREGKKGRKRKKERHGKIRRVRSGIG